MDFREIRLPRVVSDHVVGGPMYSTRVFASQSGDETHLGLYQYPLHKYELSEAEYTNDQALAVKLFWMSVMGKLYGFRMFDPVDHYAGTVAEGIFVATATANVYQMAKLYTLAYGTFIRPIVKPIPTAMQIFNSGAAVASPSLDYTTGLLTMTGTTASSLRWIGMFDTPVYFQDDWLQIGVTDALLKWKSVSMMECRRIDTSLGTPPAMTEYLYLPDFVPSPSSIALTPASQSVAAGAAATFTVTLDRPATSALTVTPATTASGGTISPATLAFAIGDQVKTFTRTPASAGSETITATATGLTTGTAGLTVTASGGPVALTSGVAQSISLATITSYYFTLAGSTNITVTLAGLGPSGSGAYGQWGWKRSGTAGSGFPPYDGAQQTGSGTQTISVSAAGTESFRVDVIATNAGTATITATSA